MMINMKLKILLNTLVLSSSVFMGATFAETPAEKGLKIAQAADKLKLRRTTLIEKMKKM